MQGVGPRQSSEALWLCARRRQEEFERALEDCCIRREPLGWDRKHRCYWWGVAGERGAVYVQDWNGHMGALSTPEQLDALMDALEPRGVREHGLQGSLEKVCLPSPSKHQQRLPYFCMGAVSTLKQLDALTDASGAKERARVRPAGLPGEGAFLEGLPGEGAFLERLPGQGSAKILRYLRLALGETPMMPEMSPEAPVNNDFSHACRCTMPSPMR